MTLTIQDLGSIGELVGCLAVLVTLADYKAIFFYLSFLPAFLDLAAVSTLDLVVLSLIVVFAVGIPKIVYTVLATRTLQRMKGRARVISRRVLAGSLIVVGIYAGARA